MAIIRMTRNFYEWLVSVGNFFQHLFLLAVRLYWGWAFHMAGCQKIQDIDRVTEFFTSLAIPFPEVSAYTVAIIECVGGILLLVGLAARLISIPLAVIMIVALATVHTGGAVEIFSNQQKFMVETPVTYLLTTLTVFVFGPGWLSLDFMIESLLNRRKR